MTIGQKRRRSRDYRSAYLEAMEKSESYLSNRSKKKFRSPDRFHSSTQSVHSSNSGQSKRIDNVNFDYRNRYRQAKDYIAKNSYAFKAEARKRYLDSQEFEEI